MYVYMYVSEMWITSPAPCEALGELLAQQPEGDAWDPSPVPGRATDLYLGSGLKLWDLTTNCSHFIGKMMIVYDKSLDLWVPYFQTMPLPYGDGSKPYPPGEHQNSW